MAHRDEIGSANIPAITAERSVSEKKLLMFMALKQSSAASVELPSRRNDENLCCYLQTRW